MILRYVSVKLTQRVGMGVHSYSKICITDGKWEGEEGDDESCFTMTLDEFNEHDWEEPLYDDVYATLIHEMPPKLQAHYDGCCKDSLEYVDTDYNDEEETHQCAECRMEWCLPIEKVQHYEDIMPSDSQYEHDGPPRGITPLAFLRLYKQKELF